MELLQYLLSFFIKEYGKDFAPLIELLQKNGFDLKRTLKNANLETLAPIIKAFMEKAQKNSPENSGLSNYGLSPISAFADKDVVFVLNKYFGND